MSAPDKRSSASGTSPTNPTAKRQKNDDGSTANTSKPSATGMYTSADGTKKPRDWTLSVALPSSIVHNAQSHELRSYLVGEIARTLTIYGVDEIVIYEDRRDLLGAPLGSGRKNDHSSSWGGSSYDSWGGGGKGNDWGNNSWGKSSWNEGWGEDTKKESDPTATTPTEEPDSTSPGAAFFIRNLQYLETPQYLRKILFPMHPDLKFSGLQNPLDAPHHLRKGEQLEFREGVVLEEKYWPSDAWKNGERKNGVYICCGLDAPVWVSTEAELPAGVRVTVRLLTDEEGRRGLGEFVSQSTPREEGGLYWGYGVRYVGDLQSVFLEPPVFWDGEEGGDGGDGANKQKAKAKKCGLGGRRRSLGD